MKGKKLSSYAAILVVTLFGTGATMLIVDAAHSSTEAYEAAAFDPTAPDADFEKGKNKERSIEEKPAS